VSVIVFTPVSPTIGAGMPAMAGRFTVVGSTTVTVFDWGDSFAVAGSAGFLQAVIISMIAVIVAITPKILVFILYSPFYTDGELYTASSLITIFARAKGIY
jgi:hypothetical protein